ncbi:MAG TPA: SGNH/GDSL hydrolase family protein [Candidatus Hydrogenedentes bacterium]|nr:SGNH/GDSL hydrolase family protein [Candidatus Hydrogenedentota bacterium]HPG66869.1 SGNH/GDSL hydrolase family protein [Candidatus Hydrogenedentota bacterium]
MNKMLCVTLWCIGLALAPAAQDPAADDTLEIVLPRHVYAVSGIECNVYFEDVILALNLDNYAVDVSCSKGLQQSERWTFTPKAEDAGAHEFAIRVCDAANHVVADAASTLVVIREDAGKDQAVSALLIGDSLTHASIYSQHLLDLCVPPNGPTLTLVGSHVPQEGAPLNRHEGYGGWTAKRFSTHYTGVARTGNAKECGSPFLYEVEGGEKRLDFARYCVEVNGGRAPDFITIFLGCNDTFGATDDTIDASIDDMFSHLDTLIEMIRRDAPDAWIGLLPPVGPAATQDAFGANYACGQTRWQYRRNQHRDIVRMLERYEGREAERIAIVPAYVNLDCVHNYPLVAAPCNARSAIEVSRLNNGVHPAAEGYRQIGDAIYAWMKSILATAPSSP